MVRVPLATNTVVVNFEQLAANVLDTAVDVILLDTTFWGGIRACVKAAGVCETFQLGVAVHSSGELGIQLATMLHLGAVIPNLSFAADAHYHHLTDDIIEGGLMQYEDGVDRGARRAGAGRQAGSRQAAAVSRAVPASSAAIRTIRTRCGPAGPRSAQRSVGGPEGRPRARGVGATPRAAVRSTPSTPARRSPPRASRDAASRRGARSPVPGPTPPVALSRESSRRKNGWKIFSTASAGTPGP